MCQLTELGIMEDCCATAMVFTPKLIRCGAIANSESVYIKETLLYAWGGAYTLDEMGIASFICALTVFRNELGVKITGLSTKQQGEDAYHIFSERLHSLDKCIAALVDVNFDKLMQGFNADNVDVIATYEASVRDAVESALQYIID